MAPAGTDETREERRSPHWRVHEIGVMVMLLAQLAGLIWGAATLKSGVDQTAAVVSELRAIVDRVDERQRRGEIEDARRDGRMDAIQGMLTELQKRVR
jgi:hypothetical protein